MDTLKIRVGHNLQLKIATEDERNIKKMFILKHIHNQIIKNRENNNKKKNTIEDFVLKIISKGWRLK